jgi:hypothetical protein
MPKIIGCEGWSPSMNKESRERVLLALCAFIFPALVFFSTLVQHFQITIEGIDEIPFFVILILALVLIMSPISWSLLLGWYVLSKVTQSSMSSIAMLEELQSQEILHTESTNRSQSDFYDNNAVS